MPPAKGTCPYCLQRITATLKPYWRSHIKIKSAEDIKKMDFNPAHFILDEHDEHTSSQRCDGSGSEPLDIDFVKK